MKFKLEHTGFNRLGHMVKTLYINDVETEYRFCNSGEKDTYGIVGDGDYPHFYNTIKHTSASNLPAAASVPLVASIPLPPAN